MIITVTLAIIAIIGLSYFLIIKKKKKNLTSPAPPPTTTISVTYPNAPDFPDLTKGYSNNTSIGSAALTKNYNVEPTSAPIHKTAEVENNLGAETAVITPETKVPKKRAPRKKKEEKV